MRRQSLLLTVGEIFETHWTAIARLKLGSLQAVSFQVHDCLGVVLIDVVFQITPQIEIWGVKVRKAPGSASILPDLNKHCKTTLLQPLHEILRQCWREGVAPQDMRDTKIVTLYENNGERSYSNNYRGISLLSIVGKVYARILLIRLQKLAERVHPKSRCGFRTKRFLVNIIFSLRQLQEKCREQRTPLYVTFIELTMTFDLVSRDGFFKALRKIGCPPKLHSLILSFHTNMKGTFTYLGFTITDNLSLDAEIDKKIGKAATTLARLKSRVWTNPKLTMKTKTAVHNACVLSTLLYGSETWTTHACQEKRLNSFHLRSLRRILGISWQDKMTNTDVLSRVGLPTMYTLLRQRRLRRLGHVCRMEYGQIPKDTLHGELATRQRGLGRPQLRYKDVCKRDMNALNINTNS
ncbi:uncharacterized protein LOC143026733 [Oratosquilla oratoria]|uniref:uncharacterized protein LOC143026733 n=1 Tax=Oratosquilla oratoria TaxID=337810 RepID=UPI003F7751C2